MKVILKKAGRKPILIVVSETQVEQGEVSEWCKDLEDHVFSLQVNGKQSFALSDLGDIKDACRESVNAVSISSDPDARLLSNLAHTPFELDGQRYESVEGFWQSLKFSDREKRKEIAKLHDKDAKSAGYDAPDYSEIEYGGEKVRVGTYGHWQLMKRACLAKFSQHTEARRALLSTGERPIVHKVKKDSRTIPGVIFAEILMKIRKKIQKETP